VMLIFEDVEMNTL